MLEDDMQALEPLDDQNQSVCERCAKLCWNDLVDTEPIASTLWERNKSMCRICDFVDRFLSNTKLFNSKNEADLRFKYVGDYPYFNQWSHLNSKHVCHISESRTLGPYHPHILVTRIKPDGIHLALKYVVPGALDTSLFTLWIADCERLHGQHCLLAQQPNLTGLKVIDCEQQRVVLAPEGCRYVALSYVWGTLPQATNLSDWDMVPKTIQDSMRLTQQMGLGYLWVDRYVCADLHTPHGSSLTMEVH